MKVRIKKFSVDMEVKNAGIEFQVNSNDGAHLGDCYITKKGLIWCQGRRLKANGVTVTWDEFIRWMED